MLLELAVVDAERGMGALGVSLTDDALDHLVELSAGDARAALTALEAAVLLADAGETVIDGARVADAVQKRIVAYDRGDNHFDVVSAFIKSMRGSDPDATLFWLGRMIHAGEDPRFMVRRMVIFASEDVGLADPHALPVAVAAAHALEHVGMPEARFNLAEAALYLARAPKSNSVDRRAGEGDGRRGLDRPVPPHLRDAHYAGAAKLGHGEGYEYPHDFEGHHVEQQYRPERFEDTSTTSRPARARGRGRAGHGRARSEGAMEQQEKSPARQPRARGRLRRATEASPEPWVCWANAHPRTSEVTDDAPGSHRRRDRADRPGRVLGTAGPVPLPRPAEHVPGARGDPPHGGRDAGGDRPAAPGDQGFRRADERSSRSRRSRARLRRAASSGGWSGSRA